VTLEKPSGGGVQILLVIPGEYLSYQLHIERVYGIQGSNQFDDPSEETRTIETID